MNGIPQKQNTPKQLDRLAATSQLYLGAKCILAAQIILSIPAVLGLSALAAIDSRLDPYAAYWGVTVAIVDAAILEPWQQRLKRRAALTQELFDCELFELPWHELATGPRPSTEAVAKEASRYRRKYPKPSWLENWYPVAVGQLPLELARIICQRINCWWDGELRRRYSFWVIVVVIVLSILVILLGVVGGFSVGKFFQVVLAPLIPALLLGYRQFTANRDAAAKLDDLKAHAENFWNLAIQNQLPDEELLNRSRELQDEIFDNRQNSPLIFNWIYRRFRTDQENQMKQGAEELIQQATHTQ
mgnify:CR=1 FL=1